MNRMLRMGLVYAVVSFGFAAITSPAPVILLPGEKPYKVPQKKSGEIRGKKKHSQKMRSGRRKAKVKH